VILGSLFSGIGGFDLAFERAGVRAAWQVEIDKPCQKVLARHFPESARHADVAAAGRETLGSIDVVCGGFPCQDLSVAGGRKGLAGKRSGLWREFHRILAELRPGWVVIENVPGLLSSNDGRDFAVVLHGLGELGYLTAWRVLDAQFFGLAQRRNRVFIVGHLGSGRAAEVLFERTGVPGDPAPGGKAGQDVAFALTASVRKSGDGHGNAWNTTYPVAGTLGGSSQSGGFRTTDLDNSGAFVVADTVTSKWAKGTGGPAGDEVQNLVAVSVSENQQGQLRTGDIAGALAGGGGKPGQGYQAVLRMREGKAGGGKGPLIREDQSMTLATANDQALFDGPAVRRLTPTECERLQGFPDGWTDGHADTQRYKMLGNAVAVPVVEWIARRIVGAELTGGD